MSTAVAMKGATSAVADRPKVFRPKAQHGVPRRVAEYLDWAAATHPGQMIRYEKIAAIVLGLPCKLGQDSELTRCIRSELYRARVLLIELFSRDLVTDGRSARATIDGKDIFDHRYQLEVTKAVRQADRVQRTIELIEANGLGAAAAEVGRHLDEARERMKQIGDSYLGISTKAKALAPNAADFRGRLLH